MAKPMRATEARIHPGDVLDQVEHRGSRIIIERGGRPAAMLISLPESKELGDEDIDVEALIQRAHKKRKACAKELNGQPVPDFVEIVQEMREERDAQLLENVLRRQSRGQLGHQISNGSDSRQDS